MKNRRSIRKYKQDPVSPEAINRILEAGRQAPSAKNRQPWRFVVVSEKSQKDKLTEAAYGQESVAQAPVVVAICTTNVEYIMPNNQPAFPVDLSFAASFLMLQAEAEGLGTCIVTTYNEAQVRDILTVPYSMRVLFLLCIGYADEIPKQTQRKPLDSIVSYEHW